MNAVGAQIEIAQAGLVQRTQKYLDAAALKLVESVTSQDGSSIQVAPRGNAPPVQPVLAAPREGATLHVVA